MDNVKNNAKNNAQNCGKNNKPVDVKQDNKNKASNTAQNVKQDNKNSAYRADKLFNDTATGGNRPARNRRDDDETDF
ncbi:MAG: hypothetical protein IJY04_01585 [Clostridia bacterium]|nr:hypothetical protein [Clostridia bacterium]